MNTNVAHGRESNGPGMMPASGVELHREIEALEAEVESLIAKATELTRAASVVPATELANATAAVAARESAVRAAAVARDRLSVARGKRDALRRAADAAAESERRARDETARVDLRKRVDAALAVERAKACAELDAIAEESAQFEARGRELATVAAAVRARFDEQIAAARTLAAERAQLPPTALPLEENHVAARLAYLRAVSDGLSPRDTEHAVWLTLRPMHLTAPPAPPAFAAAGFDEAARIRAYFDGSYAATCRAILAGDAPAKAGS